MIAFLGSTRGGNVSMGNIGFFSNLTFHINKKETFKTWGQSLQLPYANEAKF